MVARVGEWWKCGQIQRRQNFDTRVAGEIGLMLPRAPFSLGFIAREQNTNGMQVRAVEPALPMIGMVRAGITDYLGASAMPCRNSSGKVASDESATPSARRPFQVNATEIQRLSWSIDVIDGLRRGNFVKDPSEPSPPLCRLTERKEFVAPGECRNARQQDMLDIVKFQHSLPLPCAAPGSLLLHLVEHR